MKKRFKDYINKKAILKSGLFDEKYYLLTYPDVEKSNLDPLTHYLQIGAKEGKNPSKDFDTKYYLENNSDVKKIGINPLIHYTKHGKREGRKAIENAQTINKTNIRTLASKLLKKQSINEKKHIIREIVFGLLPNFILKIKNKNIYKTIDKSRKVIIVFPIISWHFRWQRPQQIFSRLAKQGYTILYVSMNFLPKNKQHYLEKIDKNIFEVFLSSKYIINIYNAEIHQANTDSIKSQIIDILNNIDTKNSPIYFIQFPNWYSLLKDIKSEAGGHIVFDCMDEHSGFSNVSNSVSTQEKDLLKASDLVISSSNKLYEKNKKINQNTIMVKNGTEYDYFSKKPSINELEKLADKPIIGYYGAISDWFDIELIEYCAKMRPEYNFVLIGATFGCNTENAVKYPNIHFLGEKPYSELTKYLYSFDVCTIPFKIIPLIEATNPVKFYEYISAGKPVVSTMLPELFEYQEVCYLAKDKDEFLVKIDEALKEKSQQNYDGLFQKRLQIAQENSWDNRVANLIKHLDKLNLVENLNLLIKEVQNLQWNIDARKIFQKNGINISPSNFYSEIPSVEEIESYYNKIGHSTPFFDKSIFKINILKAYLDKLMVYSSEFAPAYEEKEANGKFFWNNSQFNYCDAMAYYCFIRLLNPRNIIEIGSGFSTLIAIEGTQKNNINSKITCIEPFPRDFLENNSKIVLDKIKAQDLSIEYLNNILSDGDILFIDSTHTVKQGGDCLSIYLELIPNIKHDIYIHVHNIFLPFPIPKEWQLEHQIYWTEQYLLMALIIDNPKFEVIYGSQINKLLFEEDMNMFMSGKNQVKGASFWLKYNGKYKEWENND